MCYTGHLGRLWWRGVAGWGGVEAGMAAVRKGEVRWGRSRRWGGVGWRVGVWGGVGEREVWVEVGLGRGSSEATGFQFVYVIYIS